MENKFVIKKDAFFNCFTPFILNDVGGVGSVIDYSALLKKDVTVYYDDTKIILSKIEINRLTIIYIIRKDFDQEFKQSIIDFEKKTLIIQIVVLNLYT